MAKSRTPVSVNTKKARLYDARVGAENANRKSAMEYHFGDWSVPVDGISMMYHKTSRKISEIESNPNLTLSEIMSLRRRRANIAINYGC